MRTRANDSSKMKQILPILFFILTTTPVDHLTVNSWPMTTPARQSNDATNLQRNQLNEGHEPVASLRPAILVSKNPLELNHIQSNQVPAREASILNRPSSQTSDREASLQQKHGSSLASPVSHSPVAAPGAVTRIESAPTTSLRNNTNYKQNYSAVLNDDRLSEGSGLGPLPSGHRRPKLDDTEDSGDDSGDDDDDYDYRETPDNGSGHSLITTTTTTTKRPNHGPVRGEIVEQPNDFYNPFRPPTLAVDSSSKQITGAQQEITARQVPSTTRLPSRVGPASPNVPIVSPTTTNAPRIPTATTTPMIVNANNGTRAEVDYDYEDENEDDDSEETSVFEDNDSGETVYSSKPVSKQPSNSTIHTQTNSSDDKSNPSKTEISRPTVNNAASFTNQSARYPTTTTEMPMTTAQRYTTPRPIMRQTTITPMTSRPAITLPTAFSQPSGNAGVRPSETDEELEGDEEEEEEEEEEEDEEEDIGVDDREDDEPLVGVHQTGHSNTAINGQYNNSLLVTKPPAIFMTASTNAPSYRGPSMQTSGPVISPSHNKHGPFDHDRPTTTSPVVSARTTVAPDQIISVPIYTSTTTTAPTSPKVTTTPNTMVLSSSLKPTVEYGTTMTSLYPVYSQPTRKPTLSPAFGTTTYIPAEKPKYMVTSPPPPSPPNTPSSRPPAPPQPPITTNIIQYDRALHSNNDTLTKQIYDKAVGVYQEADKTIRAAWQAVWPPNLNFDSAAVEPLLNQPLFFMLTLGGVVIGLVLLMMLVVYIITYQIQPRDDDSSIY